MDHPDKTLEKSFIETVANSDLKDVAQTTAEVVRLKHGSHRLSTLL